MVVGAWAMAHHGRPRYTGDLDIVVEPSEKNGGRLLRALKKFGVPTTHIAVEDIVTPGTTITFGVPPRRIDILNWLSGLTYEEAASDAEDGQLGDVPVRFLSLRAFRLNKEAAARERDADDLRALE